MAASLNRALGRTICRLRQCNNMSQAELSRKSGVTQATVSYIEAGRKSTSLEVLFQLAAGLGVRPSEMLAIVDQALQSEGVKEAIRERAQEVLDKTEGWMSLQEAERRLNRGSKGGGTAAEV